MTRTQTYDLIDCRGQTTADTSRVSPGSTVKVGFQPEIETHLKGEWMWVIVTETIEPGKWIGFLDNHPTMCPSLRLGDTIFFEAKNVFAVEGQK